MTTTTPEAVAPAPVDPAAESPYRAQTLALAAVAAAEMTAAVSAPVPDGTFVATGAAVVARAASRAVVAADLSLAAVLADGTGSPPLPLGLLPRDGVATRAARGLRTLLDTLPPPEPGAPELDGPAAAARREPITARAVRLARAESLAAGQNATTDAMTARPEVTGWVRQASADACPLCAGLAARDEVLEPSHPMARHAGCSCLQRVTNRPPTRGRTT